MSTPRVSVVIPAYNAAAFIADTLETVASQTYRDFEVVVVDDGSKDDTKPVVDRFLKEKKLAGRCIRQANKKIAGARNTGIREAQGKYIALLDHDDAWFPEKLRTVMAEFDAHPDCHLVCHNENITEQGRFLRLHRNGPWSQDMYARLLFKGNALSPSCVVVLREKILEIGGFREDAEFVTVEDYDLWMRLAKVARFRFIDDVLAEYHFEERGASRKTVYHHTNLELMLRDHFRTLFGPEPGWGARWRVRRRLSVVYRSALGLLMTYGEDPAAQRDYALRMIRAFPFDPKNAAKFLIWAGRALCRR